MVKPKAKVIRYDKVPAVLFGKEAPGTSIRQLISNNLDGAPVYDMRMIEIEPHGHTPHHSHPYEHENFIVDGRGEVFFEGEWRELGPGDVVFVPPGVQHQYRNTGDSIFRFLCSVPAEHLRPTG